MDNALQQLIMDIMADADLKTSALADPAALLAQRGITLPLGHSVKFLEDTETLTHIVLPCADEAGEKTNALEQRTSKMCGW